VAAGDEIVQPSRISVTTEAWENAAGGKREVHGVRAFFPLSVLAAGNEFRLVRDDGTETAEPVTAKALALIR
jgi:hypothetical protein